MKTIAAVAWEPKKPLVVEEIDIEGLIYIPECGLCKVCRFVRPQGVTYWIGYFRKA